LIGSGLLLMLSLVSYTPGDLPIWGLLENYALTMEANSPRANFIGAVGALLGFVQILIVGGAAYLLPLGLIWMGVAKVFMEAGFTWRTWIGFGVFLMAGASLLAVQSSFFSMWPSRFVIASSGGILGKALGVFVF
jgi:hypothetical protein